MFGSACYTLIFRTTAMHAFVGARLVSPSPRSGKRLKGEASLAPTICLLLLILSGAGPTTDGDTWFVLPENDVKLGAHHTRHAEVFGNYVTGYNAQVLAGIDSVQATQPNGGVYFTGLKLK